MVILALVHTKLTMILVNPIGMVGEGEQKGKNRGKADKNFNQKHVKGKGKQN